MEIERKFLVKNDSWQSLIQKTEEITQFYLTDRNHSPTVRLRTKGDKGYVTLKYPSQSKLALVREEFEYEIPIRDVHDQIKHATGHVIRKTRHQVVGPDGHIWEVDEFHEPRQGLVLAEIELTDERDSFQVPDWADTEVTQQPEYSNLALSFSK